MARRGELDIEQKMVHVRPEVKQAKFGPDRVELAKQAELQAVRAVAKRVGRAAQKGVSMPDLYHSIVKHLKGKGFDDSAAWPIAVEAVAVGCLYGESNLPGEDGKQKLGVTAKARYCKAYAEYKKNHPKGSGIGKRRGKG